MSIKEYDLNFDHPPSKFNKTLKIKATSKIFLYVFSSPVINIITPTDPDETLMILPNNKISTVILAITNSSPKKDSK